MNRRAYLAATGATVQLAIAGCSSPGGDGGNDAESGNESPQRDASGFYPDVGDTFESVNGIEVTVDDLQLATEIRFGNDTGDVAPDEDMFVLVHLVSANAGDEIQSLPPASDFTLVSNGNRFDPLREQGGGGEELVQPLEGSRYEGLADARPGDSRAGWIVYRIPRETSRVTVSLSSGGIEAYWRTDVDPDTLRT